MRSLPLGWLAWCPIALCACQGTPPRSPGGPAPERWVGESVRNAAVERAIVVQHTLFAYHFVEDAAELNPLGRRDLSVLAAHLREHTGELNVRRGGVSKKLYDERVKAVAEALVHAGVAKEQFEIGDGPPDGGGITSERIISILARPSQPFGSVATPPASTGFTQPTTQAGVGVTNP